MKKLFKYFIFVILAASMFGCIAIKANKYQEVKHEELKILSVKKSKVFIKWDFHSSLDGQAKQNVVDKIKSDQKKMFNEIVKESGCCDLVDEKEEADIVIDGAFYNESSNAGIYFASLSGMSLMTIPCWMNSKMRISAEVKKGKMINNYDIDDSVLIAMWLPFILSMPFTGDGAKVEENVNKNLYKNLILEMKEDGFFDR